MATQTHIDLACHVDFDSPAVTDWASTFDCTAQFIRLSGPFETPIFRFFGSLENIERLAADYFDPEYH